MEGWNNLTNLISVHEVSTGDITLTSSEGGQICIGSTCCGVCVSIPNVAKVVCKLQVNKMIVLC